MKRKSILTYFFLALVIVVTIIVVLVLIVKNNSDNDVRAFKSEKEFVKFVNKNDAESKKLKLILTLPYSSMIGLFEPATELYDIVDTNTNRSSGFNDFSVDLPTTTPDSVSSTKNKSQSKDYSKTNLQVENVDEADIVKTDGDYIYSVSDNCVVITKVLGNGDLQVESKISSIGTPEDILIKDNYIVIISSNNNSRTDYSLFDVFDITNKQIPVKKKRITTPFKYSTSRMIDSNVYIFSSGSVEFDSNKKLKSIYYVDNRKKDIDYTKIYYLKDGQDDIMTSVISFDLNNIDDISFSGIMMDLDNAYISEKNIYLIDTGYKNSYYNSSYGYKYSDIFGFKGIFGIFDEDKDSEKEDDGYYHKTTIYKFNINKKDIKYSCNVKESGQTLNQFSMDEYEGNLRITLNDLNNASKLCIFDEKLNKIGQLENIAPGEKLYSTRFINNRAYMVTYKTMDPLFVIDLTDVKNPTILGELKIPGYSTYLHPYDENHIIGIGNDTNTTVYRDSKGRVTSESTVITGMKMALFDITDVNNPKELYMTKIGDKNTYSSILTNHKALLFSKERGNLGIPVNNYSSQIAVNFDGDSVEDSDMSSRISKDRVSFGYLIYDLSLENGFNLKGSITHLANNYYNNYINYSKEIRGIYIDDILYTISNQYIKSNNLSDLKEIRSLKIN